MKTVAAAAATTTICVDEPHVAVQRLIAVVVVYDGRLALRSSARRKHLTVFRVNARPHICTPQYRLYRNILILLSRHHHHHHHHYDRNAIDDTRRILRKLYVFPTRGPD